MAHGELYATGFGWDTSFEALVSRSVADYAAVHDPGAGGGLDRRTRRRAGWAASHCVAEDDQTAKLRILLVTHAGRGHGLGGRLVDTCMAFAREAGYRRMRLWTNHLLGRRPANMAAAGFVLASEQPHHSFRVDLIG